MKHNRRKFLRTAGGIIVVLGGGMIGLPLGCKSSQGGGLVDGAGNDIYTPEDLALIQDLTPEDLAGLPEATEEEAREFLDQVDAQAEVHAEELVDDAGNPKVPPGQHVVETQPVMAYNNNPGELADWRFTVTGEVENELEFTWEQWQKLPHVDIVASFHCVTAWTMLDIPWGGVRPKTLFDLAGVKPSGQFVIQDCEHGYKTNLDIAELTKDNVLFADRYFGDALPNKYGGPVRGMISDRYGYKSGKWVVGIRILDHDEPGYWETKGYSNTADVWTEDRYS
jgi:DMSO/TMAO reductase YedYZ molybdopterin-dependent catalytic subunit